MRIPEPALETIRAACDGDRKSVEAIVRAIEPPVYNLALRMLLSVTDAEDASQEALLRVVTRLVQFRGESKFSTWVWQVATRCVLDWRTRNRSRRQLSFESFQRDLADGLDVAAPERGDDRALLSELKIGCARALLQCLDDDHRAAYILGEIIGLASEEASVVVEVTPETFRKRLSRARERVRAMLETCCGIVNESAACRCHRRLDRARQLGRVTSGAPAPDLVQLRATIRTLDAVDRAAAHYRADPAERASRDLVSSTLEAIGGRSA
jgi:RNA polymerase sigma factor (sigma-70 family)